MPTALITGIEGFTGRYLAAALREQGYQVVGLRHGQHAPEQGLFACDLLDRSRVAEVIAEIQPDVVAHLAAISFVAHGDAAEIYRTNIIGTRNLLEALAGCEKCPDTVLLASSANIYGNANVDPIDELVPPQPANDYAVSKLAMEHMACLWMDKLPIVIVRPFNYTGVGQSLNFLLPKIVDHFRRGALEIELGNLDVARDFSDVRTVVKTYVKLLQISPVGEVFNVCSGQAYTLQEMLTMMTEIAGYEIAVKVNPAFVRENEVKRLRGSNAKLMKVVGAIERIPLEQTLRWMYEGDSAE